VLWGSTGVQLGRVRGVRLELAYTYEVIACVTRFTVAAIWFD
jgi:hypothetical protein